MKTFTEWLEEKEPELYNEVEAMKGLRGLGAKTALAGAGILSTLGLGGQQTQAADAPLKAGTEIEQPAGEKKPHWLPPKAAIGYYRAMDAAETRRKIAREYSPGIIKAAEEEYNRNPRPYGDLWMHLDYDKQVTLLNQMKGKVGRNFIKGIYSKYNKKKCPDSYKKGGKYYNKIMIEAPDKYPEIENLPNDAWPLYMHLMKQYPEGGPERQEIKKELNSGWLQISPEQREKLPELLHQALDPKSKDVGKGYFPPMPKRNF